MWCVTVSHARTFVASVLLVLRERQSGAFRRLIIHPLFIFSYDVSFFLLLLCFLFLSSSQWNVRPIHRSASRQFIHKLNTTLRPSSSSALVGDSAPHRRRKTRCYIACGSRRCRIDEHVPVVLFCSNESRLCGDQWGGGRRRRRVQQLDASD